MHAACSPCVALASLRFLRSRSGGGSRGGRRSSGRRLGVSLGNGLERNSTTSCWRCSSRRGPGRRCRRCRSARGRLGSAKRLVEHRGRRTTTACHDRQDERDADEEAAAPPGQLGEQVACLACPHELVGRRGGATETRRHTATLPALQEDDRDENHGIEDQYDQEERGHRGINEGLSKRGKPRRIADLARCIKYVQGQTSRQLRGWRLPPKARQPEARRAKLPHSRDLHCRRRG